MGILNLHVMFVGTDHESRFLEDNGNWDETQNLG